MPTPLDMLHATFGPSLALHEPGSILVFEDHSSYVDTSPAHVKMGLIPQMRAMCQAQRDFVAAHGLRFHRTLTDEEAARDDVAALMRGLVAECVAVGRAVGADLGLPQMLGLMPAVDLVASLPISVSSRKAARGR